MKKFIVLITAIFICCNACKQKKYKAQQGVIVKNVLPFNIQQPDRRWDMPDELHEISGIATVNDSIIACIADEKGTVYFYNLNNSTVDHKLKFTGKGDFEDLAIIGETIYVLDSKGTIWVIKNYNQEPEITSVVLNIEQPFELEGFCHRGDTLFTAAKYYHNEKRNQAGTLPVWRLTAQLQPEQSLFSVPDFVAPGVNGQSVPFHTSAIVYDEHTLRWYCLSTHTKIFIQCDYNGKIISAETLSEKEFSQPEGICFTTSGDLLISNEGREGAGSILLFKNLSNKQ